MKSDGQCERLLNYLKAGNTIDGIRSWNTLGIYRLAARVHNLRSMGYNVQDRWVKGINRFSETVKWKEYFLEKGNIYREF